MVFSSVITMANSIIGVSILAMPFCFKQCGIILATLLLIISGLLVKMVCHLMLKSAIIARRRNYEILAFHTFGYPGKLAVEVSMIGFLMGTCIAFFVVMGDLGPPFIANLMGIESTSNLRLVIMIALALFVTLPLALLRNVESLAGICTASIVFYTVVLFHIVFAASGAIFEGSWKSQVNLWRPAGVLQCVPIFFMALSCQPQVFEIYDALPEPSISKMNEVVRSAVNLCTGVYLSVGFFGYIAFASHDFGGNILTEFPPSMFVEMLKLGFVLSVAVSFPLVIFPCRTSVHSLVFNKGSPPLNNEIVSNYIPPAKFNAITIFVVLVTLVIGISIPDIELVLGLVGSTIGSVITIVFPAIIFIKLTTKNTTERLAAQTIFVVGILVIFTGTYVNLYAVDRAAKASVEAVNMDSPPIQAQQQGVQQKPAIENPVKEDKVTIDKPEVPGQVPVKEDKKEAEKKEDSKATKDNGTAVLKEKEKDLEIKEKKAEKLIEELNKQKDEHKKIIQEQKEILKQLKEHADEDKHQKREESPPKGDGGEVKEEKKNEQPSDQPAVQQEAQRVLPTNQQNPKVQAQTSPKSFQEALPENQQNSWQEQYHQKPQKQNHDQAPQKGGQEVVPQQPEKASSSGGPDQVVVGQQDQLAPQQKQQQPQADLIPNNQDQPKADLVPTQKKEEENPSSQNKEQQKKKKKVETKREIEKNEVGRDLKSAEEEEEDLLRRKKRCLDDGTLCNDEEAAVEAGGIRRRQIGLA